MPASLPAYPFIAAAIDIGGTKIAGALVTFTAFDEAPQVTNAFSIPCAPERGGGAVLATVIDVAERLIASAAQASVPLIGIGVDAAGIVDPETGSIAYANEIMPGWTGQPVRERLVAATGLPVAVMGDVHAHALGEARWGAARDAESCLLVGVGTGLGGAYVLKGSVVRGFHGAAGHLGHTLHHAAAGIRCSCGASSHVESVTSGTAISARYQGRSVGEALDPSFMGDEVARRAVAGEERARNVLEFCGEALGEAIGSWCNALDPACVVLSGSVVNAGPVWRTAVERGISAQTLAPLADIPLIDGALGGAAPLIGAAENLVDALAGTRP